MTTLAYTYTLTAGTPENVNQLMQNLNDVKAVVNGSLDHNNLTASAGLTSGQLADAAKLGLTDGSTVRRGKFTAGSENKSMNTTMDFMPTPDRVQNVVLATDGLICMAYRCEAAAQTGVTLRAGLFLGANPVKADDGTGTLTNAETQFPGSSGNQRWLSTNGASGLTRSAAASAVTTPVTTGQLVSANGGGGGDAIVCLFAAAGTYDVSVKFAVASGTGTVFLADRKLWVWTIGF